MSNLLSVHEVAIRLSVSEDTVVTWAQEGTLAARMMDGTYWFEPTDVAAYGNQYPDADPPGDGTINDLIRPIT